jgi:predicted nucleic acid-binding protein
MIVVDTNVMVYLLAGVGPGEEARKLLERDPEWTAPSLLRSELRNVVLGLVRRGRLEMADALEICRDAEAILGDRVASLPDGAVLAAAEEAGLTAYDAEYVALARALGVPLVTADTAILDAAPDVAVGLG